MSESYHIRVKGYLDPAWSAEFEGLQLRHLADGTTLLQGSLADQAALHGVLARIRDLGLTLLVVQQDEQQDGMESMVQITFTI
jgi:hypothetical protein